MIVIRPAEIQDLHLILSTWLKSFRDSPVSRKLPTTHYFKNHEPNIKMILGRAQVLCAVNTDDPNQVYGWICIEPMGKTPVLHYLYVKQTFRGLGIGSKLLAKLDSPTFFYTHNNRVWMEWRKWERTEDERDTWDRGGVFWPYGITTKGIE